MTRASQLTIAAARMALDDAGLTPPIPDGERVGAIIGSAAGGLEIVDREGIIGISEESQESLDHTTQIKHSRQRRNRKYIAHLSRLDFV
jgi:3-oxoacyl-(acyl-carrier-protein) synthase